MGRDHDRCIGAVGPGEEGIEERACSRVIQLPCGLVGEQQCGLADSGADECYALRLPARNFLGQFRTQVVQADSAKACRARSAASGPESPANCSGKATFSVTVSQGMRLGDCIIMASPVGRSPGTGPRAGQAIVPLVGASSPAIRCSSVDLPVPDRPVSAIRSAALIRKFASCSATTFVSPVV